MAEGEKGGGASGVIGVVELGGLGLGVWGRGSLGWTIDWDLRGGVIGSVFGRMTRHCMLRWVGNLQRIIVVLSG